MKYKVTAFVNCVPQLEYVVNTLIDAYTLCDALQSCQDLTENSPPFYTQIETVEN